MARNLIGLYRDLGVAEQLVRDLVGSGVPTDHISVIAQDSSRQGDRRIDGLSPLRNDSNILASGPLRNSLTTGSTGFSHGARSNDISHALTTSGVPANEASLYHEGISRGGALIAVEVRSHDPALIAEVMERYDPVDLDASGKTWREQGWKGTTNQASTDTKAFSGKNQTDKTIPIVEEEVDISKRGVVRGGVRVHSRPVTEKVERDISLREEEVNVERRPVNRPLNPTDDAFREETVEMVERGEEAVVNKTARVTEEVHIGKRSHEHTEHISETARHTEVEIERLSAEEFGRYEPRFREHFGSTYKGERFDDYRPGYELGVILARDGRSQGRSRDWSELEPLARTRWEKGRHGQTMPYDRARDSIAFGYDEARSSKV